MIKEFFRNGFLHINYWFIREVIRTRKLGKPLKSIFPFYLSYINSNMNYSRTPLFLGLPWITFGAIDFLVKIIKSDMIVFEFGSGGSTRFFAERVKELHSVESDEIWYSRVKANLSSFKNFNLVLRKGEECINQKMDFVGDEGMDSLNYFKYSNEIMNYKDQYFDLIFIDGKARNQCILNSLSKLKKGGWLIVDNSNRKSYFIKLDLIKDWEVFKSFGPALTSKRFTQTTFYKKP